MAPDGGFSMCVVMMRLPASARMGFTRGYVPSAALRSPAGQGDSDSVRFDQIADSDPSDLVVRCVRALRTSSHAHSPSHCRDLYKRITPSHERKIPSGSPISSDTLTPGQAKWLDRKPSDLSPDFKLRSNQPNLEQDLEIRGRSARPGRREH